MTTARLNLTLWLLAVALLAGAAAIAAASWLVPLRQPPAAATTTRVMPPSAPSRPPLPPLAELQRLSTAGLYRPPATPVAPEPPPPPPATRPALRASLVGTVHEPGRERAVFVLPSGRLVLRAQGQSVEGAKVLTIEPQRVTVDFEGEVLTLRVPRRAQGAGP